MNPYPGLIIHVVADLTASRATVAAAHPGATTAAINAMARKDYAVQTAKAPGIAQKCIPAIVTDVEIDRLILTLFAPAGAATDAARRVLLMRNAGTFHELGECPLWGPDPWHRPIVVSDADI